MDYNQLINDALMQYPFSTLLSKSVASEEREECARMLGLPVNVSHYTAAAISEFTNQNTETNQVQSEGAARHEFMMSVLRQEWNAMQCQSVYAAFGHFPDHLIVIIALESSEESTQYARIKAIMEELMRRFEFRSGIAAQCLMGMDVLSLELLPKSYIQTIELGSFSRLLERKERVCAYEEVSRPHPWSRNEVYGFEARTTRMLNALSVNDFPLVQQILNEMIDVDFYEGVWVVQMTNVTKYTLLNYIRITMEHMKMVVGTDFFDSNPWDFFSIIYQQGISEIREGMNALFDCYAAYAETVKNGSAPVWNQVLKEHIRKDLGNPELTVVKLADRLGLNPAYMGRIFKKYNNIALMDFIHQLRIEAATELMDQGYRLKDIAQMVGYDSPHRFCEVFKRYTGQTPSIVRQKRLESLESIERKREGI